jgi:hypothetical protein
MFLFTSLTRTEDDRQIWKVAANILNKQSRTTDKGCPPTWGLGMGLIAPYRKKNYLVTKCHKGTRTWTDSLDERPKLMKMGDLRER